MGGDSYGKFWREPEKREQCGREKRSDDGAHVKTCVIFQGYFRG